MIGRGWGTDNHPQNTDGAQEVEGGDQMGAEGQSSKKVVQVAISQADLSPRPNCPSPPGKTIGVMRPVSQMGKLRPELEAGDEIQVLPPFPRGSFVQVPSSLCASVSLSV